MTDAQVRHEAEPGPGGFACRACGDRCSDTPVVVREMMLATREPFEYRQCSLCGSLSLVAIPDDLGRHYPTAYYSNEARETVIQDAAWKRPFVRILTTRELFNRTPHLRRLARRLATYPKGEVLAVMGLVQGAGLRGFRDRILDAGCGAQPVRLAQLRKVGFVHLDGVDPFIPSSTRWQGVPIRKGYLGDVRGRYNLIMFHHSLEHVLDPVATLDQARERLAPGGRVLVRTPLLDGYMWETFGTDWVEIDAPRHTTIFSLDGLTRLASRTGFEVAAVTWEAGAWALIASEQYQRDLAMYEPGSWFVDPAATAYDKERLRALNATARHLRETGESGRAAVWLRPTDLEPRA